MTWSEIKLKTSFRALMSLYYSITEIKISLQRTKTYYIQGTKSLLPMCDNKTSISLKGNAFSVG